MKIRIRNIVLLLAIPLLVSYYLVQNSFIHYHHLSDGHIIVHSHPYNDSEAGDDTPQHKHLASELILLQLFNTNFSADIQVVIVDDDLVNYFDTSTLFYTSLYSLLKENKLLLRGPPELV